MSYYKRRKMALGGTLLNLGLGLAIDTFNEMKMNNQRLKDQAREKELFDRSMSEIRENQEKNLLSNFPSQGVRRISNFATGGKLPFKGKTVHKLKGDSHFEDSDGDGNTGIMIKSADGQNIAEVEGGEVIFDDMIFSRRLRLPNGKTFADEAISLSKTKAFKDAIKAEKEGEGVVDNPKADIFKKGTVSRNIEKNPNPLRLLFQEQEVAKAAFEQQNQSTDGVPSKEGAEGSPTVPKGQFGLNLNEAKLNKGLDTIGENLGQGVALIDNIFNRRLIQNTPNVPSPTLRTAPKLETDININPQLDDISTTVKGLEQGVRSSVSNSAIANTNVIAANIQGLRERNRLRGEEINKEIELKNQQKLLDTQIDNENKGLLDQFRQQTFQRAGDIRRERSANTANLVEDLRQIQRDKANDKLARQRLALIAAQYAESGVLARADLDKIMNMVDKGADIDEIVANMEEIKKRKQLKVPESIGRRDIGTLTPTSPSVFTNNPETFKIRLLNTLNK